MGRRALGAVLILAGLAIGDYVLLQGSVAYEGGVDFQQGVSLSLPMEPGSHSIEMTPVAAILLEWNIAPPGSAPIQRREQRTTAGRRMLFFHADAPGLCTIVVRGGYRPFDPVDGRSGSGTIVLRRGDRRVLARILSWF